MFFCRLLCRRCQHFKVRFQQAGISEIRDGEASPLPWEEVSCRRLHIWPCGETTTAASAYSVAWSRASHRLTSACDVCRQTPRSCPVPETLFRSSALEHDVPKP